MNDLWGYFETANVDGLAHRLLIAALVAVLAIAWWRFVTEAGADAQTAPPQDGLHQ